MRSILTSLALVLALLGLTGPPLAASTNSPPSEVYAVGHSIPAGYGLSAAWRDAWPARAGNLLCGFGCARMHTVAHAGQCLFITFCAYGPTLLSTFQTEVLAASPAPTAVVLDIGINDLSHGTDAAMEAAYQQIKTWCDAAGVRLIVGTITPTGLALAWRSIIEPQRLRINTWIRATFGADVVDFDAVLRAPNGTLDPIYDQGDGLHPDALGAVRMADMTAGLGL